jgi:hypothetical protein
MNMMIRKIAFALIASVSLTAVGCAEHNDTTAGERLVTVVEEGAARVADMQAKDEIITMRTALDIMMPIELGIREFTASLTVALGDPAQADLVDHENAMMARAAEDLKPVLAALTLQSKANAVAQDAEEAVICEDTPEDPTEPTDPGDPTVPSDPSLDLGTPDQPTADSAPFAAKAACYATAAIAWRRCTLRCACRVIPNLIAKCAVQCGIFYATAAGLCEAITND